MDDTDKQKCDRQRLVSVSAQRLEKLIVETEVIVERIEEVFGSVIFHSPSKMPGPAHAEIPGSDLGNLLDRIANRLDASLGNIRLMCEQADL